MQTNLTERMDNLIDSLHAANEGIDAGDFDGARRALDNAEGIAGEVPTMIDGR